MGGKFFLLNPNELFIWAYPENLVEIGLLVEAVDTFCGTGRDGTAWETSRLYRQPQPGLSLALALAEVCQFYFY